MAFLGWYEPDRKMPARVKLGHAIDRYEEKFGRCPTICLTSPQDAEDLGDDTDIPIEARNYIARHTFYVGQIEDATPAAKGATA